MSTVIMSVVRFEKSGETDCGLKDVKDERKLDNQKYSYDHTSENNYPQLTVGNFVLRRRDSEVNKNKSISALEWG